MSSQSREGLLAVCGTLSGLSIIAVGLRFVARRNQHLPLKADDGLAVLSLLAYLGAAICVFIMVHNKVLGYSETDLSKAEIAATAETSSKAQIALDVLTTSSLAFTKLSALYFYRRIFCVGGKTTWFDVASKVTIVIVVLWLFVFQFLTGFQCGTHFSALWDGTYVKYCTISFPFLYGLAVSDFLLDVWILALPIPRVLTLNATKSKKLSIIGVFLLAFVGLGASVARMVAYIQVELGGETYFLTHDEERTLTRTFYVAMLEAGISLVAVNLPSLWMLCTSVVPEKAAQSLRSVLSFTSLRSSRSSSHSDIEKAGYITKKTTSAVTSHGSDSSTELHPPLPPSSAYFQDLEAYKSEAYASRASSGSF